MTCQNLGMGSLDGHHFHDDFCPANIYLGVLPFGSIYSGGCYPINHLINHLTHQFSHLIVSNTQLNVNLDSTVPDSRRVGLVCQKQEEGVQPSQRALNSFSAPLSLKCLNEFFHAIPSHLILTRIRRSTTKPPLQTTDEGSPNKLRLRWDPLILDANPTPESTPHPILTDAPGE